MERFFTIGVHIFEVLGVIVMLLGLAIAAVLAVVTWRRERSGEAAFVTFRHAIGLSILLGLELLVAADIVKTLVAPTFEEVAVLGIIVLIRTALSFALQIEIEGTLPWRRALLATSPELIGKALHASRVKRAGESDDTGEQHNP